MGAVGHVNKIFMRQFALQSPQYAQAAHTTVKHPYGRLVLDGRV
jgi:hypothetical protein